MKPRVVALAATVLWSALGAFAFADPPPAPPPPPPPPSTSNPLHNLPAIPPEVRNNPFVQSVINGLGGLLQTTNGNSAVGRVTYFRRFDLQVETAKSVYRSVHLHQGTVINPRGATLAPGMYVTVTGAGQHDGSLNADTITVR